MQGCPLHILSLCCPSPSTTDRCCSMHGCLSPCSSFTHARATVTSPLQTPTTLSSTTLALASDRSSLLAGFVQNARSTFRVRRSETRLCMTHSDDVVTNRRRKFQKQKPRWSCLLVWNRASIRSSHMFQIWEPFSDERRIVSAGQAKKVHDKSALSLSLHDQFEIE